MKSTQLFFVVLFVFFISIIFTENVYSLEKHYKILNLGTIGSDSDPNYAVRITPENKIFGQNTVGWKNGDEALEIHAFVWDIDHGISDLGLIYKHDRRFFKVFEYHCILGMNDSGEAICLYLPEKPFYPFKRGVFFWSPRTGIIDIAKPYTLRMPSNINSRGEVILTLAEPTLDNLYFWKKEVGLTRIEYPSKIGEDTVHRGNIFLTHISENSEALGYYYKDSSKKSFLTMWNIEEGFIKIPPPQDYDNFVPISIKDTSVFGFSMKSDNIPKYFLWDAAKEYVSINDIDYSPNNIISLNNLGDIILMLPALESKNVYLSNIHDTSNLMPLPVIGELASSSYSMNDNGIIINNSHIQCPVSVERAFVLMPVSDASYVNMTRGDVNSDDSINLTDAVVILNHLFRGECLICPDIGDVNDDGALNLTDAVYLLHYLFSGGSSPIGDPLSCSSTQ